MDCKTEWTNSLNFKSDRREKERSTKREICISRFRKKRFTQNVFHDERKRERAEGWKINSTTFGPIHVVAHSWCCACVGMEDWKDVLHHPFFSHRKWLPYGKRDKVIALCKFNHSSLWVKWAVLLSSLWSGRRQRTRRSFLEIDFSSDCSHSLFSS